MPTGLRQLRSTSAFTHTLGRASARLELVCGSTSTEAGVRQLALGYLGLRCWLTSARSSSSFW